MAMPAGFWAVMDIGTNSVRLLVAAVDGGRIVPLRRELVTARLGQGMGKSILPEAAERTLAALRKFRRSIQDTVGSERAEIRLAGTQFLREADNAPEFRERVAQALGWELEILPGPQEAWLSYIGATNGLSLSGNSGNSASSAGGAGRGNGDGRGTGSEDGDGSRIGAGSEGGAGSGAGDSNGAGSEDAAVWAVLDIGGGSTEIMLPGKDGRLAGASVPLGALRLYQRPMTSGEIQDYLKEKWRDIPFPEAFSLVGVAGTCTTLGAIHLGMTRYDAERLSGMVMSRAQIEAIQSRILPMTPARRLEVPGMTPGREDIIPYGIGLLLEIMEFLRRDRVVVQDADLLQGLILRDLGIVGDFSIH
jgi:exopolyphosphatase/guanosine-5'-triphosphate,3'-diphosphate pyrophosphatase